MTWGFVMRVLLAVPFMVSIGAATLVQAEESRFNLRLEAGPVWQSINRVEIPSPGGSRINLASFGAGPRFAARLDASWRLSTDGELRVLFAPLALQFQGTLDSPANYQGTQFASGAATTARFVFNSYRLTYRYRMVASDRWTLWGGLTGKIRDAEIRLTQGSLVATKTNVGFVPLLHAVVAYRVSPVLDLRLEMDALAAPQGRAEDIALLGVWSWSERTKWIAGYRTIEGGSAGGGGVYTFAWLHYAVAAVSVSF